MPNYDLSYPGSSGYGILPGGRYGRVYTPPPTQAQTQRTDYGVMQADGTVVSVLTGQPWSGVEPRTGVHYTAGRQTQNPAGAGVQVPGSNRTIDPNNPAQRYQPVDIVKSPTVAGATSNLFDTFRKTADQSMQDFGTHLNNFRNDVNTARGAATRATDIAPTIGAVTGAVRGYEGNLDTSNAAYQQALAAQAARERGVVTAAENLLPQYDTALTNIEQNNLAQVARNNALYRLRTGTPNSMGSDATALLARESTQAALPIEQARINRRYDILTGLALPVERDISGANIQYAGSYLPGIASARYGAETNTAQYIQSLKERIAGLTAAQAVQFMQMAGVPAQIQQQILQGQIGELGGLAQLEDQSRYRGLQDVLGVNPSQSVYYNQGLPSYPNYAPRYPNTANLAQPTGRPIQVGPGGSVVPDTGLSTGTSRYGGYAYRPLAGAPGGPPVGSYAPWTDAQMQAAMAQEGFPGMDVPNPPVAGSNYGGVEGTRDFTPAY